MLQIQTANLPEAQQHMLHADFLADEKAYLQMRTSLLEKYRGQWVAVHNGNVIAVGASLMQVLDQAAKSNGHPFIALVGAEDTVVFRVRHTVFSYDQAYQPFPLPRVTVTFWNHAQTHSQRYADVIPDTGSDVSLLPDADCKAIDLFSSPYMTGRAGGVMGSFATALLYRGNVEMDGQNFSALIQPVPTRERIVGRDVLNQQRVLFDGPAGQVIVDP